MDWIEQAFESAVSAAEESAPARRRWRGQNRWDEDHMNTESTRFPNDLHAELIACCESAGVTRYALIAYLLRTWIAAWKARE